MKVNPSGPQIGAHRPMNPSTQTPLKVPATPRSRTLPENLGHHHKVEEWSLGCKHIYLADFPRVLDMLNEIARGTFSRHDDIAVQAVFNTLILHKEFTIFVEVFKAYNEAVILQHEWSQSHPNAMAVERFRSPFKSTLTLDLPEDWSLDSQKEMEEAFQRIRVDRLIVLAPRAPHGFASNDVCTAVATLLKTGKPTELIVHGCLRSPETVADALAQSSLHSIELGGEGWAGSFVNTARELTKGLAHCPTIRNLTLNHTGLVSLHKEVAALASKLQTVKLLGEASTQSTELDRSELISFVHAVASLPKLSECVLTANVGGAADLQDAFLAPFKGHSKLAKLEINGPNRYTSVIEEQKALPVLLDFSLTCPKLKHLQWGGLLDRFSAKQEMTGSLSGVPGADTVLTVVSMIKKAIRNPQFKLDSLTLNGSPVWDEVIFALMDELKANKSIVQLNLLHNMLSLRAMSRAIWMVNEHNSQRSLMVDGDARSFYVNPHDVHAAEEKPVLDGWLRKQERESRTGELPPAVFSSPAGPLMSRWGTPKFPWDDIETLPAPEMHDGVGARLLAAVKAKDVEQVLGLLPGARIDMDRFAPFATSFEMVDALQSYWRHATTTTTTTMTTTTTAVTAAPGNASGGTFVTSNAHTGTEHA